MNGRRAIRFEGEKQKEAFKEYAKAHGLKILPTTWGAYALKTASVPNGPVLVEGETGLIETEIKATEVAVAYYVR